jgi:hypothetical protein
MVAIADVGSVPQNESTAKNYDPKESDTMSTEPASWRDASPPAVPVFSSGSRRHIDVQALARQQGVEPIQDPDVLRGDFWPEDESIDDFLQALRASRRDEMP